MTRTIILITILFLTKVSLGQTNCDCTPPSISMVSKLFSFGNYDDQVDFLLKECYVWTKSTVNGQTSSVEELRKCTKNVKNNFNEVISYKVYKMSNDAKDYKSWTLVLFDKTDYFKIKDFVKLKGTKETDKVYTYNQVYYFFGTGVSGDNMPFYLIRVSKVE